MTWVSIPATVLETCARLGDAEAAVDGGDRVTYDDLARRIRAATAAFIASGVQRGDRVALWGPNSVAWIVAAVGLQGAGATLIPINTRFKGAEAAPILARTQAKLLVTVTGFLDIDPVDMLAASGVDLPDLDDVVILAGDVPDRTVSWEDFLSRGAEVDESVIRDRIASVGPEDLCDIMFTSGTTGVPKGVMMNHGQTLEQFDGWCDFAGLREGDRYLIANPFFHMFGYKAGWLACLIRGATIVPISVFDVEAALDLIEREQITVFPGAPTLYQMILDHPATSGADLSSLRVAITGAADIPVELIRRMHEELPFESIMTGYGLTEACTCAGTRAGDDFETIATTSGRPSVGVEMCIVDQNNVELPRGETGEIVVRGGNVMQGYLDDAEATAAAIDSHGWLHTGDLGTMDERDCLRIVGRLKDMLIVGGFNAYPAEIENTLLGHPAIAQVAVIGIPDARLGEVACAFVVLATDASADEAGLISWSRDQMANYKVPRSIRFLDELPLNATGKVMKEGLRQM